MEGSDKRPPGTALVAVTCVETLFKEELEEGDLTRVDLLLLVADPRGP